MTRLFILLALMLAIDLYAFQALRKVTERSGRTVRRLCYALYWLLVAAGFAFTLLNVFEYTEVWSREAKTVGRTAVFLLYLSKLPVVLFMLVDDLRRVGSWLLSRTRSEHTHDPSRSRFLSRTALVAGGVPLATLTYGIVRNAYRYRRFTSRVPVKDLPPGLEGLRIVQISDMHSGSWTRSEPLHRAVEMINKEKPDIVCFTGDIVNSQASEMLPFIDIFSKIEAKYGVYSVLGNHDYGDYHDWPSPEAKEENTQLLYDVHRLLGWDLLLNESRVLEIAGHKLGIIGVENWSNVARFPKYGDLSVAKAGTEDCACRVLLSHDPTHWDAQVRPDHPDIDLTLSGHTHGFQFGVEIPGFRWSPAQYLYARWAGLYREGKQSLYVNRGLGFLGYPGRVGILPEVTVLELGKADEKLT